VLIPLGTDRQQVRGPIVTPWLIGINVVAFVVQMVLERQSPEQYERLLDTLAVVGGEGFGAWQLVTSAFLHGGLLHLLGNMLFLWVFGPNVEDRFGRLGFLGFYLGGAIASSALHATFEWVPVSQVPPGMEGQVTDGRLYIPAIGASGAISGVTGAYLVLFPKTLVRIIYFFFFIGTAAIPAWWFIGFNIGWNLLSQAIGVDQGVAFLAHLGGYGYGIALSMALLGLNVFPREPYDLWTIWRQARRRQAIRVAGEHVQREQAQRIREIQRAERRGTPQTDAIGEARTRVVEALHDGRSDEAASAYRALLADHGVGPATLSRQHQMDLANVLFRESDYQTAALVYDRFLETYPEDREAPVVRVMLGLINARYLNDPERAKQLLHRAKQDGLDDEHTRVADRLLHELG